MDDELRIHSIRPYPADDESGRRRWEKDEESEENSADRPAADPEPEVQDGHIDTRVAPETWGVNFTKVGDPVGR